MGKDKELNQRLNRIRKLQERQKKSARGAVDQASELDDILAVSRAEHEGVDPDRPLRSASELMGPSGGAPRARPRDTVDTDGAYARNLAAAHFASPEAFSRNKNRPPALLGPGATGIGAGLRPQPIRSIQRPGTAAPADAEQPTTTTRVAEPEPNAPETTLVVRRRQNPPASGRPPAPLEGTPTETLVMRERKIPKDAVTEEGDVLPTDHIDTLPGAGGRVDPSAQTSVHIRARAPASARSLQTPVPPTDHVDTLPGAGSKVDPTGETLVGRPASPLPNVSIRKPGEVAPTDHVVTAPGTAGLERVTKSERTEVVRRRRLHPDAVDPESGDVLPTDHVVTAPGLAGLDTGGVEHTMPRIDVRKRATAPLDPMVHSETIPIERVAENPAAESEQVAPRREQPPTSDEGPESTMVVRKRKTPRDG